MNRFSVALTLSICLGSTPVFAGWFSKGVGKYGPYTGGHGYSYATAYHYGFAWSAADTWKRDIFAYPAGISPYRPNGRPIYKRVFPRPDTPYIAVPGPDGLPTLIKPMAPAETLVDGPMGQTILAPEGAPILQPVPQVSSGTTGTIKMQVPEHAEVWVEKEKLTQTGRERMFQTDTLPPGQMKILSVRAKWLEAGREVEQFRVVGVKAGETARLTFGSQP